MCALKYTFVIQGLITKNGIMMSLKQIQKMNRKIFLLQPITLTKTAETLLLVDNEKARLVENYVKRFFFRELIEVRPFFRTIFRNAPRCTTINVSFIVMRLTHYNKRNIFVYNFVMRIAHYRIL